MIARNEQTHIGRALESVQPVASQIIVVDTGSTDDTPQIARDAGAQLYHYPWQENFSKARNHALAHCTCPWIMWLDADDQLPSHSIDCIRQLLRYATTHVASGSISNQTEKHLYSFRQIRLFPNHPSVLFSGAIHEQLLFDTTRFRFVHHPQLIIDHHGYLHHQDRRRKAQRNKTLLLKKIGSQSPPSPLDLLHLAITEQALENFSEAEAIAHRALKLSCCPDFIKAYLLGIIAQQQYFRKEHTDALQTLQQVLECNSVFAPHLFLMARVLRELGQEQLSQRFCACALKNVHTSSNIPFDSADLQQKIRLFIAESPQKFH